MRPAQSRCVPRPPVRALTCASAPRPRRGSAGPRRYATATGPRAAPGQPHNHAALQVRKRAGQLTSAARKPEISHGQGGHRHHQPCPLHGRQESPQIQALPGLYSDSAAGPQGRTKQHSSWSDRCRLYRFCGWPGQASGASAAQRPDSNRSTVRLLLYFAAVLGLSPGLIFSNCASDLWSYGDSNPRPLACHQQAARPQRCICAGQRPTASTPIHPGPGRLRYFRAVLPRLSMSVAVLPSRDLRSPRLPRCEGASPGVDTATTALSIEPDAGHLTRDPAT